MYALNDDEYIYMQSKDENALYLKQNIDNDVPNKIKLCFI